MAGLLIAQNNFEPGFIVDANGDTLKGQVDYQGKKINAMKCLFKANGRTKEYNPHMIEAYGFDRGEVYRAKLINTSDNEESYNFLQLLVDGKVRLYVYYDILAKERIFIENDNLGINELREVKRPVGSTNNYVLYKEYIGYLKVYLPGQKTENQSLELKSVKKLVESYNKNSGKPVKSYPLKAKKGKGSRQKAVVLSLGAGITYSFAKYKLMDSFGSRMTISDDYSSFNYPGIFFDLTLKFPFIWKGGFSITTGASIQYMKYQIEYSWPNDESELIDYEQNNLYIPLGFTYEILRKKFRPYVTIGAMFVMALYPENNNYMATIQPTFAFIINNDDFVSQMAFFSKAGLRFYLTDKLNLDLGFGLTRFHIIGVDIYEYKMKEGNIITSYKAYRLYTRANHFTTSFSVSYSF